MTRLLLFVFLYLPAHALLSQSTSLSEADIQAIFEAHGVQGTFVLHEPGTGQSVVYQAQRAATPFLPASTFKILNALIALETGVARDEQELIAWDGVKRRFPDWNRDHTLASAFRYSVVPFYQEIARRIGAKRMQTWVDSVRYGNRNIGGGIDQFWLTGELRTTAWEQISFLEKLHRGQLPFSERSLQIVKQIMIEEQTPRYVLRGKTGWAFEAEIGWYVGWIESQGKAWFFALNLDVRSDKDTAARKIIARQVLQKAGLL